VDVTDKNGEELITQTAAAELRGMSLAAVNQHVRSGRWRSQLKYGKRLVYRSDVLSFEPKTHKTKHLKVASKRTANEPHTKSKPRSSKRQAKK
jgi:hypothetical protein